jgi:hypothetical protein
MKWCNENEMKRYFLSIETFYSFSFTFIFGGWKTVCTMENKLKAPREFSENVFVFLFYLFFSNYRLQTIRNKNDPKIHNRIFRGEMETICFVIKKCIANKIKWHLPWNGLFSNLNKTLNIGTLVSENHFGLKT